MAQVQHRAEQHEPEHRVAQLPHLMRSRTTQAEKTQAEKHHASPSAGPLAVEYLGRRVEWAAGEAQRFRASCLLVDIHH